MRKTMGYEAAVRNNWLDKYPQSNFMGCLQYHGVQWTKMYSDLHTYISVNMYNTYNYVIAYFILKYVSDAI